MSDLTSNQDVHPPLPPLPCAQADAAMADAQLAHDSHTSEPHTGTPAVLPTLDLIHEMQSQIDRLKRVAEEAVLRPADVDALTLRRARLARYKTLLNQQSRKLIAARNGLAKRQAECEQVISQRSKLAELSSALNARQSEVEQRAARGTGAVFAACACVVIGIVGGLAWTIAGVVAPATYAAQATLAPKDAQAAPPEELKAWTDSHLALVKDPTTYAEAAEYFTRRGVEPLASPAAVQQRFSADLYAHSDTPGAITLELRGPGREHTTRDLETFLSALLARSEASRGMRGDALVPFVFAQPKAGDEPLSSERLVYAAAICTGGIVLALVAGVAGFMVLANSKKQFEREQVEVTLN